MSSNVIDYFAVLGRGPGELRCDPFRNVFSDEKNIISAAEVLDEAITDIAVLQAEQSPPDETWAILDTSADGNEIEPPFLAVRRFVDSKRLDYITDVKLVLPNEAIPEGYELISATLHGNDAPSLLGRGFLVIKRANTSSVRHLHSDTIIDDIQFLKKSANEELPERFQEISILPASQQGNHLTGRNAAECSVVLHRRPGLGLCNLVYESATIDRYPKEDHNKLELPVTGLPMFAFPDGMRLTLAEKGQFPLPLFFTFVFTDAEGKHFYVACLQFYETVPLEDLVSVYKSVHGAEAEFEMPSDQKIFCPKVICAVSQYPFYRAMRRFLRQLYSLSFSTLKCPLEYYIASVVDLVPFPLHGGRPFHVTLDVALISYTSKPMAPIEFSLPDTSSFPLMDVDFAAPLRCFSVDNVLLLFALMLKESKLLFVCESNTMLTECMETMRALLFPLDWSSCFVPRLPNALLGLLQAPGGFMIGLTTPPTFSNTEAYLQHLHSCRNLVTGTYTVDLTHNTISLYTGRSYEKMDATRTDNILKSLPHGPRYRLNHVLKKISAEYKVGPQVVNLSEFDSAFELQSAEGLVHAEKWESFPILLIRDAFFAFLVDFLGDYSRFILPPSEDLSADTYRTFQEEFNITGYLDGSDRTSRTSIESLLETQMFSTLLQRRGEGRTEGLVFFEKAGALVRELGLSAGGHGNNYNHSSHHRNSNNEVLEMPIPVYGLLSAAVQWAGLGQARQQQLRNNTYITGDLGGSSGTGTTIAKHQLTYISTNNNSSTLRPVATANVTNPKLDDLMSMWDYLNLFSHTESGGHSRERSATGMSSLGTPVESESEAQHSREEVNKPLSELCLDNPNVGPLILPGPSRPYSDESSSASSAAASFQYPVWPQLDPLLTAKALREGVNPSVDKIRTHRNQFEQQMGKDVLLLVRAPGLRLGFEQHGKLINPIQLPSPLPLSLPSSLPNQPQTTTVLTEDVLAVLSMVVDIVSLTLTTLSIRTSHNDNNEADNVRCKPASDVLQMLGILAQLDTLDLLPALSESVWRGVFHACANAGGDLMRRIASHLYTLLEHTVHATNTAATAHYIDTLTCGSYLRALASKKRHLGSLEPITLKRATKHAPRETVIPTIESAYVDSYVYLEEIGSTWYIQRSALYGQTLVDHNDSAHSTTSNSKTSRSPAPVSPLAGIKSLTLSRRFPASLSFRSADSSPNPSTSTTNHSHNGPLNNNAALISSVGADAVKLTAKQLKLSDGVGLLCFHRPNSQLGLYPPMQVKDFTSTASDRVEADVDNSGDSSSNNSVSDPVNAVMEVCKLSTDCNTRIDELYTGAQHHILQIVSADLAKLTNNTTTVNNTTRDRNNSNAPTATVTNTNSSSRDLSPMNATNRLAAMGSRFFSNKKADSPVPVAIELTSNSNTSNTTHASTATTDSPTVIVQKKTVNTPSSPVPGLAWAKKLNNSLFSGSPNPGSFKLYGRSISGGTNDNTPKRLSNADLTPDSGDADVELKVLSATLNFDDEVSSDGESSEKGSDSGSDSDDSAVEKVEGDTKGEDGEVVSPVFPNLNNSTKKTKASVKSLGIETTTEGVAMDSVDDLLSFSDSEKDSEKGSEKDTDASGLSVTSDVAVVGTKESDQGNSGDVVSDSVLEVKHPDQVDTLSSSSNSPLNGSPIPTTTATEIAIVTDPITITTAATTTAANASTANANATASTNSSESSSTKVKPVDVAGLQDRLVEAFLEEYRTKGHVIGIHSYTACGHCGFAMLDEEVLTRWCHGSNYEAHIKGDHKSKAARDMYAVHKITCKQCFELHTPLLHVHCYQKKNLAVESAKIDTSDFAEHKVECAYTEDVPYLSPFGLRYRLEALLLQYGSAVINTQWLHRHEPAVLWGVLWYSARLRLPSGFMHSPYSPTTTTTTTTTATSTDTNNTNNTASVALAHHQYPIVVGWRACTVQGLAARLLSGRVLDLLRPAELFPGCSSEDAGIIERVVVPALDGSPASMRIAMVHLCECTSVMAYGVSLNMTRARFLNLSLLMLAYLYNKTNLVVPREFTKIGHLNKEVLFEKAFVDAIKCVISSVDLEVMGVTEADLLATCANKNVILLRNTLGFLY